MKIPKHVYNDFNNYDKNHNGIIEQREIDALIGSRSIYDISEFKYYNVRAGMDISLFVKENRTLYGTSVQLTDKEYTEGRKILSDNQLLQTNEKRNIVGDSQKSIQVEQGEYALKTYSEDSPSLQTYNICNCVAVTVYDKKTKKGFIAHIDTIDRAMSLKKILKNCKFNPKTSEVRIIGGLTDHSEGTIEILDETMKKLNLKIVEFDILGEEKRRDILLNLKTGEVLDYREENPSYQIVLNEGKYLLTPNEQSE